MNNGITLEHYLVVSALLFALGLAGVLIRRNLLIIYMSLELMLNAANLALFMVNVVYRLRADVQSRDPDYSVLDLKADCRAYKYVEETIKMLPEKPEPVLFRQILHKVAGLGRIHASQPSFSFS